MSSCETAPCGDILQEQGFSTRDGEGIRTVIFFMGCPLRCQWCANPEAWTAAPKLAFYRHRCIGCGACASACPEGLDPRRETAEGCSRCDVCLEQCPQRALARLGRRAGVEEVVRNVLADEVFFRYSGGGVTFSGGEPTAQPDFLDALSRRLESLGIGMWLETCGHFPYRRLEGILGRMEHIFMDIKLMDEEKHRRYTGQGNAIILENARKVYDRGIPLTIRVPCIPGVSLTEGNLADMARFMLRHLPRAEVELLPYHRLGEEKYDAIGQSGDKRTFPVPDGEQMAWARSLLAQRGLNVVSYR